MTDMGRAIVVGAGIVGAACALELSEAGFHVTVIDQAPIGSGATAAGMGHLVVMDDSAAQFALTQLSQRLWDQLLPRLPANAEFERAGTIWVAADDEEMAEVDRKRVYYTDRNARVEMLTAQELYRREPNLRPGLTGGLRVLDDGVVYPPPIAQWMIEVVKARGGAAIHDHAMALEPGCARLASGQVATADIIVNAAGAAANALSPGLPMRPRKGHLAITDRYPGFVKHQLIELGYLKSAHSVNADSVAFNVQPRSTGQLLIGSSRQYGDTSNKVEPRMLSTMFARAIEYLPQLAQLSVLRTWVGFRAATNDKLPLIGPSPGQSGVYLATGHEGLGITTSLGTARLLVDQILGRAPPIAIEPYLPSRFASSHAATGAAHSS